MVLTTNSRFANFLRGPFWPALILLAGAYSFICWTDRLNDVAGDSAIYMLTAQHFSPFMATSEAAQFFAETSPYPPLYPFLLALFGGAGHLLVAHQLTALMALLAVAAFLLWMRAERLPSGTALAATVVVAIMPGLLLHIHYLLSEALFMLFGTVALWQIARAEQADSGEKNGQAKYHLSYAALSLSASVLTRSFAIAWIGAFMLYLLLRRPRGAWLAIALAWLPWLAWQPFAVKQRSSYFDVMQDRLTRVGDIDWGMYVSEQLLALKDGLAVDLIGAGSNATGAAILAALCLAAALVRLLQRKFDGIAVFASIALLVIWPFPSERVRFMLPLAFMMLGQVVLVAAELRSRLEGRFGPNGNASVGKFLRHLPAVILGLFALTFLPNVVHMAVRLTEPMPDALTDMRRSSAWYENQPLERRLRAVSFRRQVEEALRQLPQYVPPGGCVFAGKPSLMGFYGGRKSLAMTAPLNGDTSLKAYFPGDCQYAYLWPYTMMIFPEPFYPLQKIADKVTPVYAPVEQPPRADGTNLGVLVRLDRAANAPAIQLKQN